MNNEYKSLVMAFMLLGSGAAMALETNPGAEVYSEPPGNSMSANVEKNPEIPEEFRSGINAVDVSWQVIEEARLALEKVMVVNRPW